MMRTTLTITLIASLAAFAHAGDPAPKQVSAKASIIEMLIVSNSVHPNDLPPSTGDRPGFDQFVEIINRTDTPLDLTGWKLADADGETLGFPAGTILQPEQAGVFVGLPPTITRGEFMNEFREAWPGANPLFIVEGWYEKSGLNRLGSDSIGDIRLHESDDTLSDIIPDYDATTPWPILASGDYDEDAWSDYVVEPFQVLGGADFFERAELNNDPYHWATSNPVEGGRFNVQTHHFNGFVFASPGYVESVQEIEACSTDITGDGAVNMQDLGQLLGEWGDDCSLRDCEADLNGDDIINAQDLAQLLSFWGPCG